MIQNEGFRRMIQNEAFRRDLDALIDRHWDEIVLGFVDGEHDDDHTHELDEQTPNGWVLLISTGDLEVDRDGMTYQLSKLYQTVHHSTGLVADAWKQL